MHFNSEQSLGFIRKKKQIIQIVYKFLNNNSCVVCTKSCSDAML